MKPTDWIVAFAALVACVGVGVLFFQLRPLTRQIKLQHFADYTTRHQSIVLDPARRHRRARLRADGPT